MRLHFKHRYAFKVESRLFWIVFLITFFICYTPGAFAENYIPYPIVDTGQTDCYSDSGRKINCNSSGQDGAYKGLQPAYKDNGDGTVTDLNTGLMWSGNPGEKLAWEQAAAGASKFRLGGYSDWRLPTIKELYSLINFSGITGRSARESTPYIDTRFFKFEYGNRDEGERYIDSQYWSSTKYVGMTMHGSTTAFGVNFADGRIKGYPLNSPDPRRPHKLNFALYVRGNSNYGKNQFVDNGDGTVTDKATGLTWMKVDSGHLGAGHNKNGSMNWLEALDFSENLTYAGYSDWRLPNAKELQSIVDYSRSPDATGTAAIDPIFEATPLLNENKQKDFGFYWTSTTHLDGPSRGDHAVYISFGRAAGFMKDRRTGRQEFMDVHGAGAQRSDPKTGDPSRYAQGRGPQGDTVHIYNLVRCVRGGDVSK